MRYRQKAVEKDSKIALLNATVSGGDTERSRIARELHDGIGGMLSAAMMRFSTMNYENVGVKQTEAYKEAMQLLGEIGEEIRKTAHNLMPEVLLKQPLPDAIRMFCDSINQDGVLKIEFRNYGSFDSLEQTYKLNLYRIVQELIKNVTQHAEATNAIVQLLQNENKIILSVEDDGKGFNADINNGGMGLQNIRNRVESIDGDITIETEPGKGTTVFVEVLLHDNGNNKNG